MIRRGLFVQELACQASACSQCQPCSHATFRLDLRPSQRSLQTTASSSSKAKFKIREAPPPGWRHSPDQAASRKTFNAEVTEYKQKLAVLRNAWQTRVTQHNQVVCSKAALS